MHRHGYQGRKLSRERDQRKALLKGLATSLVEHGSIETTLPKAKELRRYIEKVITKAKKGDLASRRKVIASLNTLAIANKLVDEIAPQLTGRTSGHVRIERTRLRVGDGAQMAVIEFVDDLEQDNASVKPAKPAVAKKASTTADASDKAVETKRQPIASPKNTKASDKHLSNKPVVTNKRSGER